ncbi:MAG: lipid-A-disaccharide synthase [Kiloniellales bacterium]
MSDAAPGPLIFLTACEPSGDDLGARIMAALKAKTGGRVRFSGLGGEEMTAQGLVSLFPMSELSVMGIAEILPHIPNVFRRIYDTAAAIRRLRPDLVLTIDSQAFSFGVAKRVTRCGIPLVHLNAPKVWVFRPRRARRVARYYDHLLALLPFEPPYFEAVGLPCTCIGHPVVESGADRGDGRAFRRRYGIPAEAPVLCVLPGSRRSEIKYLLDIFNGVVRLMAARVPGLHLVTATVPAVAPPVSAAAARWPAPSVVVEGREDKFHGFAASDVALAASGTVSLELALAQVPMVIAYRIAALTAAVAGPFVHARFASIVNLIEDRAVIPEFLQGACRSEALADAVAALMEDEAARRTQVEGCAEVLRRLGLGGQPPSERAAEIVLELVEAGRR